MRTGSVKYLVGFFVLFALLIPPDVFAICNTDGYTVVYVNGINAPSENDVKTDTSLLETKFKGYSGIDGVHFTDGYNPSHLAVAGDLIESISQALNHPISNYDLDTILLQIYSEITTRKILLVGHSQGTFYTNEIYNYLLTHGESSQAVGVYNIATPASSVSGGGAYLTSENDKVINAVRKAASIASIIGAKQPLPANIPIPLTPQETANRYGGHSFSGAYLGSASPRIVSEIESALKKLSATEVLDTVDGGCFIPPDRDLSYYAQKAVFFVIDPVAVGVVVAGKSVAAVGQFVYKTTMTVAQAIGETFSNVFKKDQFQLAQIIDLSQETQSDQSKQTQSQPANFNRCSFDTQKSLSHSKVIINEVSWMGGISSANDEWIELKNISGSSLDISGYQLLDQAEQIKIVFPNNTKIPAGAFLLLERNSDEAVPSIKADFIYGGALSNTDEGLRLFDANCNLIDEVLANPKWPAGDNTAKKTMERNSSNLNWHTSNIVSGTPKKENSQLVVDKVEPPIIVEKQEEMDEEITPQQEEVEQQEQVQPAESFKQCSFNTDQSAQRQGVIINEVAWMGTANSANDEWIELKNISVTAVDISNWQILDKEEQIKIRFDSGSQIPAGGFYLLERTDDDTVSGIKADKIYTGGLSNSNEGLRLFDSQCNLIDEVSASPDWTAGDNAGKNTMERKSDLGWQTSANVGGTPKKENSSGYVSYGGGGGGGTPTNNQPQTNNNSSSTPAKILITEIQISPTGNRFIELYNPNNFSVDLTNWYLQRKTQTGASFGSLVSKTYFEEKVIGANSYFLISRSALDGADIVLGDLTLTESNTIQLKNSNGDVVDKVGWGQASDCENNCALELLADQSIQRKFQNNTFVDNDNNAQDFEVQTCPSPKNQLGNCAVANQSPSAFFVYTPENPNVGDLITFNAASSSDPDGNIASYQWDFGDNTTSTVSIATTTHSYSQAGNYQVSLIVFDDQSTSSTATSTIFVSSPAAPIQSTVDHIVISEVYSDITGGNQDFIELYNPTDKDFNTESWSLKILKNNTTSTDLLIKFGSKSEDITLIKSKSFLLIGFDDYGSNPQADALRSASLPNSTSTVYLIDNNSVEIDTMTYSKEIPKSQSFERKVFFGGVCVSAQNDGEFLGNGCDTDSADDFEIRDIPNPQNSQSLPEPRSAPTVPSNFNIQYSSSTMELIFNWVASQDYSTSTISYKITDISDSSSTLATINTTSTTARVSINEIGRDYKFSIQAFDKENFGSATSTSSIIVPSFFSGLYLYQDPRDSGQNLIESYYNQYPFMPDLYGQGSKWKILVFYLNSDAEKQPFIYGSIGAPGYSTSWPQETLNKILKLQLNACSGGNTPNREILVLPDIFENCNAWGGIANSALNFSELEDTHLLIKASGLGVNQDWRIPVLTGNDYLTVAYYSFIGSSRWSGGTDNFQLVSVDKTKYYFQDTVPTHYAPDFIGEIALNFDQQNSRLNISWPKASDKDTLDSLLSYEIKYNDSEEWQPISTATGTSRFVAPGDNFSISVRAKDDFGDYSASVLVANWSYPEINFSIIQDIASDWSAVFGQMDWNGNKGVSLQSITPENDLQFNTVVLRINHTGGDDYGTTFKLSVFSNNTANNQPDFNNLIASASLAGSLKNSEIQDLAFYFANPILINAGIKYWLVLEVESYSFNSYYVLTSNSWVNATVQNNLYVSGEVGKTTIRDSIYNDNVSINSDADWYMKIGMTKED